MNSAVAAVLSKASDFGICIGQLLAHVESGHVSVRVPAGQVLQAHVLESARRDVIEALESSTPAMALICVSQQAGIAAVVVGVVGLLPPSGRDVEQSDSRSKRHDRVDSYVLEAGEALELRCGGSAITLTKDGKVVIRGQDVTSRARRGNKIKGATVQIN